MASVESFLNNLLEPEETGRENLDFFLQKRRVEEIFEDLLSDLATFGRVAVYLNGETENRKTSFAKLKRALENRNYYDGFRKLLGELDERAGKLGPTNEDITPPLLREVLRKVRDVAEKSLLRPPSPPVVIKNRAEQESFRWARLIALQESAMESLKRKIAEYEQKLAERQNERRELQVRSHREMDEQLNASHVVRAEMERAGDGVIRGLQEKLAGQPQLEHLPEYLSSLDQHDQKRKRIAKLYVQLQLWIKKYDKFIGEPMPTLLELEARMAGLEEWKENVLKPQEERLREVREQVEEFEAIALEEKIQEIRKVHAVRVLQRAWKRTLELKRSKKSKKSKKGKGKKGK
uniref:Uncharacterized protein n=1 Tax=Anopheles atroparvus TaxID=41427 RepID=A0A182INL4_ANOAO